VDVRAGIVLVGWLVGWWLLWRVPWLRADEHDGADHRADPGTDAPGRAAPAEAIAVGCTIVVPARNEESSLPTLIDSLARQTVQAGQILVVDDQSSDRTAAIARAAPGVTLVPGDPVPDGWTGKAWACHQGAQLATGDTLVFLDADVALEPRGLEALLAEHRERGGLVSVQPFHQMRRAYERLSALFNVIGFMGIGAASPGHDAASRGAFGPVIVTSRADHERAGGHASVRGEIVEDIALARRYVAAGLAVHAFGGGRLARFRMYPDGLGQLVEGWSKNIATGASTVRLGRLFLIGFWFTCVLVSIQSPIELAVGASTVGWTQAVACYLLFAVQLGAMLRQVGNFGPVTAALYPGPVGIFLVVFVRSTYLTLIRRRVSWRGRTIPLSRARRWSGAAVPLDE
jgi:4,4'-diaponeurosporenoate glycosyltransferase